MKRSSKIIICIIYIMIITGVFMLLSKPVSNLMILKHLLSILIGSLILFLIVHNKINIFHISKSLLIFFILLNIYILFFGTKINGARRWVRLFGFSLQPIEMIKPLLMIVNTDLIFQSKHVETFLYFILIILTLIAQPDFGSALIIISSVFTQMIVLSFSLSLILILLCTFVFIMLIGYFLFPHIYMRLTEFIYGGGGVFGLKFQVIQSMNSISHGGLFGVGYFQGKIKNILPDAHTDFIISMISEELGSILILILYILYGILLFIIAQAMLDRQNNRILVTSIGLITQIMLHSIIHIYSAVSLIPPKGTILPFISYGGSAMIGFLFNIGCLLSMMENKKRGFIKIIHNIQTNK